MSRTTKRSRKYMSTIKKNNKVEIEAYGIYQTDKDKAFLSLDPLKVKYEGISFGLIKSLYEDLQQVKRNDDIYLNNQNKAVSEFLIKRGYNTPNVDLDALIGDLEHLLVIQDEYEYELLKLNVDGYVIGNVGLKGQVIKLAPKPDDFYKGYYKYVDSQWIIDEVKKLELYGGML